MKKTDKKKLEEFIRVDHAGERGAIKIYEGQLLALNTFHKEAKSEAFSFVITFPPDFLSYLSKSL